MAIDRTNMVSLLDMGSLMGGSTPEILEMGDGYTELTEDWGPSIASTQYINMKSKAATVSGYEFTMNPSREYLSDDMQKAIDKLFKKMPTGKECETTYYRFYKTDVVTGKTNVFEAVKIPVTVAPSSTGGEGGGSLVSSIQINGNGDIKEGFITLGSNGTYTWSDTASA